MEWPEHPVESIPAARFRPAYCPFADCPAHRDRPPAFRKHASYRRRCDGRRVPRYLCKLCGRTCSLQTFSCTYYLKRPALLRETAAALSAGSPHRAVARSLECAPATITALAARLGRHSLLLSARCLEQLKSIDEPIAFDHFETFACCQESPFGIATAVGQSSWFTYLLDPAPHRRGGRHTPAQLARLGRLKLPLRAGGYRASFVRCLDLLAPRAPADGVLRLISDGHKSYSQALERHPRKSRFRHEVYPNPKRGPKGSPRSAFALWRDRELFSIDILHTLVRDLQAHHRRETIAFGRRLNALMERSFLFAAFRNFVKLRTERRPCRTTPAMVLNLAHEPWSWRRVLAQRLFPSRIAVPEPWMQLYRREWVTPAVGNNRRHDLRHAF